MRRSSAPLLAMNAALIALAVLLLARTWTRDGDKRRTLSLESCAGEPGDCSEVQGALEVPDAIRFGAQAPTVSIVLFVDHGSVRSRQIFQRLTRALAAGTTGHATELRLLHEPGACEGAARSAAGCRAARAVECVERLVPGTGMRAAGLAFDTQWQPERDLLDDMGTLGVDVDALRRCVATDREVDARLAEHAEAAGRLGFVEGPAGFVIVSGTPPRVSPFGAWLTETALGNLTQCLVDGRCQEDP